MADRSRRRLPGVGTPHQTEPFEIIGTPPRRIMGLRVVRRLGTRGRGFLTLSRRLVRNEYEDGSVSRPYRFEMVERKGTDSVAIIPFLRHRRRVWILVKAGFRPALYYRGRGRSPGEKGHGRTLTVEAIAGSLEPGDRTRRDIDRRAVAELKEETGFGTKVSEVLTLGAGFFPSHGQCTEKIHLRSVELDPQRRGDPTGDGSVNEADTWTLLFEARDLIRRCREGEIEDPKIEIGVQRLLARLSPPAPSPKKPSREAKKPSPSIRR